MVIIIRSIISLKKWKEEKIINKSFWRVHYYLSLNYLSHIWVYSFLFISFINLILDIREINIGFYDLIHKKSSVMWYKFNENENINMLDLIMDIKYFFLNFKKNFVFYIFSCVLLCYCLSFIPVVYFTFYLINLFILILKIFINLFNKKDLTIEMKIPKKLIENKFYAYIKYFLITSPYNWSFTTIYMIFAVHKGNFRKLGGQYLLSALILKLPLWFVIKIFGYSVEIVDFIYHLRYVERSLSWKGLISEINYWISSKISMHILNDSAKMCMLLSGKKIYVYYLKLKINGSCGSKQISQNFIEKLPKNNMLFTKPYIIKLNNIDHQAFRLNDTAEIFCIFTSQKQIYTTNGTYKCLSLDRPKTKQYFSISYIDAENTDIIKGTSLEIIANNKLYDIENFCGYILKLNASFKYYSINQVFVQSSLNKNLITLNNFKTIDQLYTKDNIPLSNSFTEQEIETMEKTKIKKDILVEDFSKILTLSNVEIFNTWKNHGMNLKLFGELKETFNNMKELTDEIK